jgi:hypothetical protein
MRGVKSFNPFKSFKSWKQTGQRFTRLEWFELLNVVTGVPSLRRSVFFQRQAEPGRNFLAQLLQSSGAAAVE